MKQDISTTENSDYLTSSRMCCIEFLVSIVRSDLTKDEMQSLIQVLGRLA